MERMILMNDLRIEKYLFQSKSIDDLISNNAIFLFDSACLLSAYQWKSPILNQVKHILVNLNEEKRLKFSLQVIKQFSIGRLTQIQDQIRTIDQEISSLDSTQFLDKPASIIENTKSYPDAIAKHKTFLRAQEFYKKQLVNIKTQLSDLVLHDDFVTFLNSITKNNIIDFYSDEKLNKLYTEANKRYLNGLPFGNQSSDNDLSGYEDYIIWHDILSLNQNIIFVSDTIKKDWTNISIDGRVLSSNTFLTQEFFEKTKGHYFAQMTTKELIAHWELD